MNDTERLDVIGEYGLWLSSVDVFRDGQWVRRWDCYYGPGMDRHVNASTIREVIDAAIEDLKKNPNYMFTAILG